MARQDFGQKLTFSTFMLEEDVSFSAVFDPELSRTGVYVLYFGDGSRCVGQTGQVVTRVANHRRHNSDPVIRVDFAPISLEALNSAERAMISSLEASGVPLRNLAVNNLETFVIGEARVDQEWQPCGFLNVSADERVPMRLRGAVERANYTVALNALTVYFDDLAGAGQLLDDSWVSGASLRLNRALMRKGPSMLARHHSWEAALEVLKRARSLARPGSG